ncbi:hypothetical protein KFE25_006468 [Diacronema lutheri]|uniref:Uncharacterized protein n=1 Tax=Diacronema lutheri TaxID=2081491 RepID=A0A8J5XKY4_DIALT|nr:hypothetical protein KFE25_006468 [Diacronema lutheri]
MADRTALPLPWGRPVGTVAPLQRRDSRVPKLVDLCLDRMASRLESVVDLRPVKEQSLCMALLHRIISNGKLDFRLARVFQQCGHEEIEQALMTADLLDALPGPMDVRASRHGCAPR